MIYVTGDIHGHHSISKLGSRHWKAGKSLTYDDHVIVCGDFGLWWGDDSPKGDLYWRRWLEAKHWTTLWVDGNHENHEMLDRMPVSEWHGGRVHVDERWPHIIHLMRGEVYDVPTGDGTSVRIFSFGGAASHDMEWRTEGLDWWPREMPNLAEYENGVANLERVGWEVDYVITHDAPSKVKSRLLNDISQSMFSVRWQDDRLNGYLSDFDGRLSYRKWYFGHYHEDRVVDGRHDVLYDQIVPIGDDPVEGREWTWARR